MAMTIRFKPGRKMRRAISSRQKAARRKNIAVARAAKKKGQGKVKQMRGKAVTKQTKLRKPRGPGRGKNRRSGMSARMEHELHRFTTMTDKQLTTRLGKIRNPKKLAAFVEMARWTGKKKLGRMAKIKLQGM